MQKSEVQPYLFLTNDKKLKNMLSQEKEILPLPPRRGGYGQE